MLELLRKVNLEYGIAATSINPFHSIWKIDNPKQAYILKKFQISPSKFSELAKAINELHNSGFHALTPVLTTRNSSYFMEFARGFYSLSPWCSGEKPSFDNPMHLKIIAECFGKLHAFSRAIHFPAILSNQQGIREYQISQSFLEVLLPSLPERENLNRIDKAVIKWSPYYLLQGRCALSGLTGMQDFWPQLNKESGFCHNDPSPGNIIIHNKQCYLIDFEFSNYDLFIKEFVLLTLRALQATKWQQHTFEILLAAYQKERPLTAPEEKILPYLFCFPRRYWRFCHQRYQENLSWTEKRFQSRLREIINEEPMRRRFLQTWWPDL